MDLYSRICTNVKFPDLITCCNFVVWGNWGKSSMDLFGLFLVTSCESTFLLKKFFETLPRFLVGRWGRCCEFCGLGSPTPIHQWSPVHCAHISLLATPSPESSHENMWPGPACSPEPGRSGLILALGWRWLLFALDSDLEGWRLETTHGGCQYPSAWKAWVRNGERNPFPRKLFDTHIQSCLWVSFGQFHFWANTSHKFESRQLFVAYPITWIVHS